MNAGPHGFRKQAAQGNQAMALGIGVLRRAALHEGDIGRARVQALQVSCDPSDGCRSP
jgi:hypothetical protein